MSHPPPGRLAHLSHTWHAQATRLFRLLYLSPRRDRYLNLSTTTTPLPLISLTTSLSSVPLTHELESTTTITLGMVATSSEGGATTTCASARRVTAHRLWTSILALSAPFLPAAAAIAGNSNGRADAQAVLPIDAPAIPPLMPEPPAPAEHVFVSGAFHTRQSCSCTTACN